MNIPATFGSHLLQWFSRRRLKCLRTDGRQTPSDDNSSHNPLGQVS